MLGTANAFARTGASLVFADSLPDHPNIDPEDVRRKLTERTKAIVVVHYAGFACDMVAFAQLAHEAKAFLIEDAAHAIGAEYGDRKLGTMGDFAACSFHETKNLTCGQGGLLILNRPGYEEQAARLWENGTNRAEFFRGEADHYTWVGPGSCYTISDLNAAYLMGQLQEMTAITRNRLGQYRRYRESLEEIAKEKGFQIPIEGELQDHNGHIFWLKFGTKAIRDKILEQLNAAGVNAVFHYIPLHSSPHAQSHWPGQNCPNAESHSACSLRLPLFHSMGEEQQNFVLRTLHQLL